MTIKDGDLDQPRLRRGNNVENRECCEIETHLHV